MKRKDQSATKEKPEAKRKFVKYSTEPDLERALSESAQRAIRQKPDHARYLLRVALGLERGEEAIEELRRQLRRAEECTDKHVRGDCNA